MNNVPRLSLELAEALAVLDQEVEVITDGALEVGAERAGGAADRSRRARWLVRGFHGLYSYFIVSYSVHRQSTFYFIDKYEYKIRTYSYVDVRVF